MADVARDRTVQVRMTEAEKDGFGDAASLAGLSLSAWVRERLRRAAIRELQDAARPIAFIEHRT